MAETSAHDVVNQAQSMSDSSLIGVSGRTLTSNDAGAGDAGPDSGVEGQNQLDTNAQAAITPNQHNLNSTNKDFAAEQSLVNGQSDSYHETDGSGDHYQHMNYESAIVNGIESASYTGSEDNNYQRSIAHEGSNGSDLDTIRNDGQEPESAEGSWRRQRSGSFAKRTTGFKSVSVTKNYLAKTGVVVPSAVKSSSDRALASNQSLVSAASGPKPRLVAKLGKDSRTSSLGSAARTGGPDASMVWNRNRAVAPAPPKQFTDEELKQQYGIHLATRLQADEAGKDGKWADIDDDEDDWAPEAIQWVDGTRSSVVPPEIQVKPAQAVVPQVPQTTEVNEEAKPEGSDATPTTSISSVGKTILKPGARLNAHTRPGLVLRSVPEAPTPAAKPSAAGSNRSPWAPLPPVDKASPVTFVPPAQPPQPSSYSRRGSSAIDDFPIPSPAKEIAADDFDRSWRENDRSGQTLFNSQSGRYEPVKNARRPSRNEAGMRPPAVLQRPSHGQGEANGSGQVFHNNETGQGWSRRRDSSFTTATNSNPTAIDQEPAKPSIDPATSLSLAPSTSQDVASPTTEDGGRQTYSAHATTDVDPRTVQQQLMRQRAELNRKRKQEEEAREEAARKERIRLKLAALVPEAPISSEDQPLVDGETSVEEFSGDVAMSKPTLVETASHEAAKQDKIAKIAPLTKAGPQQHLPTEKSPATSLKSLPAPKSQRIVNKPVSPASQSLAKPALDSSASMSASPELQHLPGLGQPPAFGHDKPQPSWSRVPPPTDAAASWSNRTGHAGSLWGPPTTDRGIGNGAFDGNMSQMPPINIPTQRHAPNTIRPQYSPAVLSPHPTPSPPLSGPSPFDENAGRLRSHLTPQSTTPETNRRVPRDARNQASGLQAWRNFATNPESHDAQLVEDRMERANREFAARLEQQAQRKQDGNQVGGPEPTIRETFRQISVGDTIGSRKAISVMNFDHGGAKSTLEDHAFRQTSASHVTQQASPLHPMPNGRASRFFGPGVGRGQAIQETKHEDFDPSSVTSDSPPPPEIVGHPAFMGVDQYPHVRLPVAKPKVKLPPPPKESAPELPQRSGSVTMPSRSTNRGQPIAQSSDWQARFNGLFERKGTDKSQAAALGVVAARSVNTSPLKQPAAPITSSSKAALEVSIRTSAATVSLPSASEVGPLAGMPPSLGEDKMEVKTTEEDLMDDREFGSSPTVRVHKSVHPRAGHILESHPSNRYNTDITIAEKRWHTFEKTVAYPLSFHYLDSQHISGPQHRIFIRMLGKPEKTVIMERRSLGHGASSPKPMRGTSNYDQKKKLAQRKVSTNATMTPTSAQSSSPKSPTVRSSRAIRTLKGNGPEAKPAMVSSPQHTPQIQQEARVDEGKKATQPNSSSRKPSTQWAKPPKGPKSRGPPRSRQQQVA